MLQTQRGEKELEKTASERENRGQGQSRVLFGGKTSICHEEREKTQGVPEQGKNGVRQGGISPGQRSNLPEPMGRTGG